MLLGAPACLDWQALYEKPCAGDACNDDGSTIHDPAPGLCGDGGCDGASPPSCAEAESCDAGAVDLPEPPTNDCGNGELDGSEECDDGNDVDSDGCRNHCVFARCGDGVVREHVEECDDGNTDDDATCSKQCLVCSDVPGEGWLWSKTGHCYAYATDKQTFADASRTCATGGIAYLATLGVTDEQLPMYEELLGEESRTFWLGLTRTGATFTWHGGSTATRTYWDDGEPGTAPSDCVTHTVLSAEARETASEDAAKRGYMWRAEKCDAKFGYVCERAPALLRRDDNHAYFPGFHPSTWQEARDFCAAHGAHLATLTSEAEHGFASLSSSVNMWIGGEAPDVPGEFHWITGEAFDYRPFAPWDEPIDNDMQRCLLLSSDGYFYDKTCTDKLAYLCEVD